MEINAGSEYNQTDSMIKRDRTSRAIVAIGSPIAVLILFYFGSKEFAAWYQISELLCMIVGVIIGINFAVWIYQRSIIDNGGTQAFRTLNPVISFLNLGDGSILYGPNKHFAYWWESRAQANSINLKEVAESFEADVQVNPGTIHMKYSVRLRPDIKLIPEYLGGVASVAAELGDIISAEIIKLMSAKTVPEAMQSVPQLNTELSQKFKHGTAQDPKVSDFEARFGVIIGDVTVGEILASEEVQETMNAVAEGEIINQIILNGFGMKTQEELRQAIAKGTIQQRDVDRARTQAHALSGNPLGMTVSEQNFNLNVTGLDKLDPNLVQAITAAAGAVVAGKNIATESKSKGGT